jgi:N-acetylneuraminic acid mutarotase
MHCGNKWMAGEGGPLVSIVEEYDPVTDTWTEKSAKMPTPRVMFSVSAINGKIYAIGGGDKSLNIKNPMNPDPYGVSIVEEYDPIKDVWTKKVDMPTKRYGLSTVTVNGKIYAFGGADTLSRIKVFTTVEEYTP